MDDQLRYPRVCARDSVSLSSWALGSQCSFDRFTFAADRTGRPLGEVREGRKEEQPEPG